MAGIASSGGAKGGLESLFRAIGGAYGSLIQRGRDADAFALRDAAEKFKAVGSKYGVNSMQRSRALTDLKGQMTAASKKVEAGVIAQQLQAQAGVLADIAGLEQRDFAQEMDKLRFAEQVKGAEFGREMAQKQFEQRGAQFDAQLAAQQRRDAMARSERDRSQFSSSPAATTSTFTRARKRPGSPVAGAPSLSEIAQNRAAQIRQSQRSSPFDVRRGGFSARDQADAENLQSFFKWRRKWWLSRSATKSYCY